jgi:hypothetical protein
MRSCGARSEKENPARFSALSGSHAPSLCHRKRQRQPQLLKRAIRPRKAEDDWVQVQVLHCMMEWIRWGALTVDYGSSCGDQITDQ